MPVKTRQEVAFEEAEEEAIKEVKASILQAMAYREVTRQELADKLDIGLGYVDQLLGPDPRNMSVRAIARIFNALGFQLYFWAQPEEQGKN
jgi:hypothetical protein